MKAGRVLKARRHRLAELRLQQVLPG